MGHEGIYPPKKRGLSSYGFEVMARGRESLQLRNTLDTENYNVPAGAQATLAKMQKLGNAVAKTPEQQRENLAQFDHALNDILRYDETTELKCTHEGLAVVHGPKRLHLTVETPRLVPVIVENTADEQVMLKWSVKTDSASQPAVAGDVEVRADGFARFFVPLTLKAGQRAGLDTLRTQEKRRRCDRAGRSHRKRTDSYTRGR